MARQDPATGDRAAYKDHAVDGGAPPGVPVDGSPATTTGGAAPVDPAVVRTQPIGDEAAAPELREWEWTEGGGIKGRVYGLDGFRPGHKLATSRLIEFSAAWEVGRGQHAAGARLRHFQLLTAESAATLCEGVIVVMRSFSMYWLGAPRPAAATLDQGSLDAPPCKARVEPVAERAAPAPDSPLETHEEIAPTAQATLNPTAPEAAPVVAAAVPLAARANFSAEETTPVSPVVSEMEGYQLTLSASNRTGYFNVNEIWNDSFSVQLTYYYGGRRSSLRVHGFATAVAAALWYAKYKAGEDPSVPRGGKFRPGDGLTPPQGQAAAEVTAAPSASQATFSADAPNAMASEADGYQLMLSANNQTGYLYVGARPNGTFSVQIPSRVGSLTREYVTGFATAIAAALWYSKYAAAEDPPTPSGTYLGTSGQHSTPPQPQATAQGALASTADPAVSADGTVVGEVDGYTLNISPQNRTGYLNVNSDKSGTFFVKLQSHRGGLKVQF